jgi:hypothetical protein
MFDYVESYFKRYGRYPQAFGKVLKRLWIRGLLREVKPAHPIPFIEGTQSLDNGELHFRNAVQRK